MSKGPVRMAWQIRRVVNWKKNLNFENMFNSAAFDADYELREFMGRLRRADMSFLSLPRF